MKNFLIIVLLFMLISCESENKEMKYEDVMKKYQYIDKIENDYDEQVDNEIYQYLFSEEKNKKHIDTFFEDIKINNSKEEQFIILTKILVQINMGNPYDISNITSDNYFINNIISVINKEFLNGKNNEKYEHLLINNFTDSEIFILLRCIDYNSEFNTYDEGYHKSNIPRIQKNMNKIENKYPLIETDNENYTSKLEDYENKEKEYIKKSISNYMLDKVNYDSKLSSLVHISENNKLLVMSVPYDPFETTKPIKYLYMNIKNYKDTKFMIYKNTLYIKDGNELYSVYLDGKGENEKLIKRIKFGG